MSLSDYYAFMGLLDFLKHTAPEPPQHDNFDVLAAISKLAAVKERSHAFYQKHHVAVESAVEFISILKTHNRELNLTLAFTDSSCESVAKNLRAFMPEQELPEKIKLAIAACLKDLLPQFATVLHDSSRPRFLDECAWIEELSPSLPEVQDAALQPSV